jgi:hypothetical protein
MKRRMLHEENVIACDEDKHWSQRIVILEEFFLFFGRNNTYYV